MAFDRQQVVLQIRAERLGPGWSPMSEEKRERLRAGMRQGCGRGDDHRR